jgi:hypothetical protein
MLVSFHSLDTAVLKKGEELFARHAIQFKLPLKSSFHPVKTPPNPSQIFGNEEYSELLTIQQQQWK